MVYKSLQDFCPFQFFVLKLSGINWHRDHLNLVFGPLLGALDKVISVAVVYSLRSDAFEMDLWAPCHAFLPHY